jgi:hypothetical protein
MRHLDLEARASIGAVTGSAALLVAIVGVILSLGASADATAHHKGRAHRITAKQLAPGAVTAKAIAQGAVGKKALSESAVTSVALAEGAVNARALGAGSVTSGAIAPGSITSPALAPGSVGGAALAPRTIRVAPISDADAVAANPEWTASNTATALCGPGEALLGSGFAVTEPGDREVSFLQAMPFMGGSGNGVTGAISSNSGGTAKAQIVAICLGG